MTLLLLALLAGAADPPAPPADAEDAEDAEDADDDDVDQTVIVYDSAAVRKARDDVARALRQEGYVRHERQGDHVVYKNDVPYMPQVIVYDDGWIRLRRQPPRVHTPFHTFADQGSPAGYLLCPIMPTTCVSVGGWLVGERKLARYEQDVYDATRPQVARLADAVAREATDHRVNIDIPRRLDEIWTEPGVTDPSRRAALYAYWDSRTDTPEGQKAKDAIRAFLVGVVQASDAPFHRDELAALNARRTSPDPLDLPFPEAPAP